MTCALFDVLIGRFGDGQPATDNNDVDNTIRSVRDHLQRLLNARRDVLVHLPEYGLPDVAAVYEGLPYSADDLATAVQHTIERFEPRLRHVRVRCAPNARRDCVVGLEVVGLLPGGEQARFRTRFESGGHARVKAGEPAHA